MTNVNEGSRSVKRAGRRIVGSTKEGDYARARASAKTLVHGIQSSQNRAAESAKKDPNFGKKILARIEASKKKKEMPKEDSKLKRQGVYDSIEITRKELMAQLVESAANYEAKYRIDEYDVISTYHGKDKEGKHKRSEPVIRHSSGKETKVQPKGGKSPRERVEGLEKKVLARARNAKGPQKGNASARTSQAWTGKTSTGKQAEQAGKNRRQTSGFRPDSRKDTDR